MIYYIFDRDIRVIENVCIVLRMFNSFKEESYIFVYVY